MLALPLALLLTVVAPLPEPTTPAPVPAPEPRPGPVPTFGVPVASASSYTLQPLSLDHENVRFGLGTGVLVPGLVGAEVFFHATDASFAPGLFLDFRVAVALGVKPTAATYLGSHVGLGHFKIGFVSRKWISDEVDVIVNDFGDHTEAVPVKAASVLAHGLVVGVEPLLQDWRPPNDPVEATGVTATLLAGYHLERSIKVTAAFDHAGMRSEREQYALDLAATYGVFGPRRGLGFLVQYRKFGSWWYLGGEAGAIVWNPATDIVNGLRVGVTVGLLLDGASPPMPPVDLPCLRAGNDAERCTPEGLKDAALDAARRGRR